jgi:hypothetical protein
MYNGTTAGADGIVRLEPNLVHVRHRCRQTGARAEKYVEWKARGTRATTRYCSAKAPRARPCRVRRTRSGRSGHAVDWLGTRQDGRRESHQGVKSHGGCFLIGGRIRQDLDIIQCTPCPCRQIEKRGGLRRDFCLLIPQDWPAFPSDLRLCPTHESKSSSMAKPQSGMVAF